MPFKDKLGRPCGFLDIDEDDKRKKFRRRYFILNKAIGFFEWYNDSPSNLSDNAKPCGRIKLDYITKVDEAKKNKLDFLFVVNTPFRQYYIQANNQSESEQWVEILNDASKIIVPPEAMLSQPQGNDNDSTNNAQESEDTNTETDKPSCTYRTEIVGNVVVKKKIKEIKKVHTEEPISPPANSAGSDFNFPISSNKASLQTGLLNASENSDVVKKGWAVKQGHVRKNWKRRFFVLKKQGFAYYKSENDREPIRSIPIGDILTAKHEDGELSRQRDNLLLVATTDKLYYIQTDTPAEMHSWIDAFNATTKSSRLSTKKQKTQARQGTDFGGSSDLLDKTRSSPRTVESSQSQPQQQLKKQSSEQNMLSKSDENPALVLASGSTATDGNAQKKHRKTHRRAESEVTVLSAHALEALSLPVANTLPNTVVYNAEDVKARPESVNFSALPDQSWKSKYGDIATPSVVKSHQALLVTNRLQVHVDTRSAIKPSTVKKKRNPGVLFPFNTMLLKKQDKIDREKARYNNNSK